MADDLDLESFLRPRCPVHGTPDCSALLNACSRPQMMAKHAEPLVEEIKRLRAERDALQQRLGMVSQRLVDLASQSRSLEVKSTLIAVSRMVDGVLRAALDGPATPPQEPHPTPEAMAAEPGAWSPLRLIEQSPPAFGETCDAPWDVNPASTCVLRRGHPGPHVHVWQSVPVERITDANGDETERGADTDTENTHQQDGDHR